MNQNICYNCGGEFVERGGKRVCLYCGTIKPENVSGEEMTLLYTAYQRLRISDFSDAEQEFDDIIRRHPRNAQAYWGRLLAKYGIKYEEDYDGTKIPSCYAASIESVFNALDYKKALELADKDNREVYRKHAEYIERCRRDWIEDASKEAPYDIFISYKDSDKERGLKRTEDSVAMQDLYVQLVQKGYRVFFSHESLRGISGKKYEPYIFNALSTAKVMIVYGSKPEYINSTWVKNEWTRYLKRMRAGEKENGSLLVACEGFTPKELPSVLSSLQCFDAGEKRFYTDLFATVERILSGNRPVEKAPAPMANAVQNPSCNHKPITIPGNPPTCTEDGTTEGEFCLFCGEMVKKVEIIPATGHRFGDWQVMKAATCTENGLHERCCANCGKKETKEIPSRGGHIPGQWTTVKEATENEEGLKVKKCVVCGESVANQKIPKKQSATHPQMSEQEMFSWGYKYYYGKDGVPQDYKKAVEWFSKAAEQGDAKAQYKLGDCYYDGQGVAQDYKKAVEWYSKAAEQGDAIAQFRLGTCYVAGRGVSEDYKEASEWFLKAANQGNSFAQCALGFYYEEQGEGVPENYRKAVEWYSKAAAQGNENAKKALERLQKENQSFDRISKNNSSYSVTSATKTSRSLAYKVNEDGKTCSITGQGTCTDMDIVIPKEIDRYRVTAIQSTSLNSSGFDKDITSVVIPDSVINIGDGAFSQCKNLKSVVIPDSVTGIGWYAFSDCTSLTNVVIGCAVAHIDERAFFNCTHLSVIQYNGTEEQWKHIRKGTNWNNNSSIQIRHEKLAYKVNEDGKTCSVTGQGTYKGQDIVIPEIIDGYRVTEVASTSTISGFDNNITSVIIPNSVTSIDAWTFSNCTSLTSVVIANSVASIGVCAFNCCKKLTSIVIGKSVTSIASYAFINCTSLTNVIIPDSVTSINQATFSDCTSLTSVVIGNSVTYIDIDAFSHCTSLTSIKIPDSVKNIGKGAFDGCSSLKSLRYNGTKEQWKKIRLVGGWKKSSAIRKVECTDGDIKFLF